MPVDFVCSHLWYLHASLYVAPGRMDLCTSNRTVVIEDIQGFRSLCGIDSCVATPADFMASLIFLYSLGFWVCCWDENRSEISDWK